MQENEIIELILSKEEEIFKRFDAQMPGDPPEPLTLKEKFEVEKQIKFMLELISNNFFKGRNNNNIMIKSWYECKNYADKMVKLNKTWEVCGSPDIDYIFDNADAQEKCFEFVTRELKDIIKEFKIILN